MTPLRRICLSLALGVCGCGSARPVAEPVATVTPAPVTEPERIGPPPRVIADELAASSPDATSVVPPPRVELRREAVRPVSLPAVAVDDPHADPERGTMIVHAKDRWLAMPLQETTVDTLITGAVAETTVTQLFVNPLDRPIEAVYRFPLPTNAAVDDFWFHVGQRHVHGVMKKREEARQTYEKAKKAGQTAALLEQERPNLFSQHVANIAPGEAIRVEMHLVQPLELEHGRYRLSFPTTIGPRFNPGQPVDLDGSTDQVPDGAKVTPPTLPPGQASAQALDVSVRIATSSAVGALRSPTHRLVTEQHPTGVAIRLAADERRPDRDFVLEWSLAGTQPRATLQTQTVDEERYFTLAVQPPTTFPKRRRRARELIFVVDTSGSMSGEPLEIAKDTMRRFLGDLEPDDRFQVLRFSETVSGLGNDPLPASKANVARAMDYVDDLDAGGGTYMLQGIQAALRFPGDEGRVRMVVFLTDGFIGNETQIFETIETELGETRLFALGIGSSVNRYLLDGMARLGRGTLMVQLPGQDPGALVDAFYARIGTPVLTDVTIDWGELPVRDIVPAVQPDLFAGQPLVVRGKLDGRPHGRVTIHGRLGRHAVEIPVRLEEVDGTSETVGMASLWARATVDDLEHLRRRAREDDVRKDVEARITRLALDYRIMTEFTSFVAVDTRRITNPDGSIETVEVPVEMPRGVTMEESRASRHAGVAGSLGTTGGGAVGYGRGAGGMGIGGLTGKGKRVPKVRAARAVVTGSLDKDVIRRIMRAHMGELRACYEQGLNSDPSLEGKVVVRFGVDPQGKVVGVVIESSELADEGVEKCLVGRVKRLRFPAQTDGIDWITYPLVFEND